MSTTTRPVPSEADIHKAIGHRFPGGLYTVQHWENFLLTECTGAVLLPGGMVHPVVLFHMPILGSKTTIGEMFALGLAESDFSIGIESYDWEIFKPLIEETPYSVNGQIVSVERRTGGKRGQGLYDRIQFQFTVAEADGALAARTTITWHYNRSAQA